MDPCYGRDPIDLVSSEVMEGSTSSRFCFRLRDDDSSGQDSESDGDLCASRKRYTSHVVLEHGGATPWEEVSWRG